MKQGLGLRTLLAGALALFALSGASAAERRLALVVGESAYAGKPLATAANDAGLVAQTLQAAGFDVTGARDLGDEALRHSLREFLDKTQAAGPDAVAVVYLSGYGMQLEGENYLVPVDAQIVRDADIPLKAARLSDYLKALAGMNLKTSVVVLDAARANPFTLAGAPVAGGLAIAEPGDKVLLAYNAAPGTVAPPETGDYGVYARALAEMMREGGVPLNQLFDRVRLRVSDQTKGAQLPWNTKTASNFVFFERTAEAPPPSVNDRAFAGKSIGELGPRDGFVAALQRDTPQAYEEYLKDFPDDPNAKRARAYLAARREAISWRKARNADTRNAYWTYLRRYPRGPHVADARRRLAQLNAALEPPPAFDFVDLGVDAPPPEEIIFVDRPVLIFDDPAFGFLPPPPPPVFLLPPPVIFVDMPPPVIIVDDPIALPAPPIFTPLPNWERPPVDIVAPPQNLLLPNIHNAININNGNLIVRDPKGAILSSDALKLLGAGAAGAVIGAKLPDFSKLNMKTLPGKGPQAGVPPLGAIPPGGVPHPIPNLPGQGGAAGANGQAGLPKIPLPIQPLPPGLAGQQAAPGAGQGNGQANGQGNGQGNGQASGHVAPLPKIPLPGPTGQLPKIPLPIQPLPIPPGHAGQQAAPGGQGAQVPPPAAGSKVDLTKLPGGVKIDPEKLPKGEPKIDPDKLLQGAHRPIRPIPVPEPDHRPVHVPPAAQEMVTHPGHAPIPHLPARPQPTEGAVEPPHHMVPPPHVTPPHVVLPAHPEAHAPQIPHLPTQAPVAPKAGPKHCEIVNGHPVCK